MLQRVTLRVTGTVQGVFFRATVQEYALQHQFGGLVKNEYDGSVSITADGDQSTLESFIGWIQSSPGRSLVRSVTVTWSAPETPHKDFRIV